METKRLYLDCNSAVAILISLLRILIDGFPYRPRHEYHLPTKKEEDLNLALLYPPLVSLKTLCSLCLVHSRCDNLGGGIIVGEV